MSKKHAKRNADAKQTKRFAVEFYYNQYSKATEIIEAKSLEEAQQIADDMNAFDINEFDPVDGELSVESVNEVQEGGRHV